MLCHSMSLHGSEVEIEVFFALRAILSEIWSFTLINKLIGSKLINRRSETKNSLTSWHPMTVASNLEKVGQSSIFDLKVGHWPIFVNVMSYYVITWVGSRNWVYFCPSTNHPRDIVDFMNFHVKGSRTNWENTKGCHGWVVWAITVKLMGHRQCVNVFRSIKFRKYIFVYCKVISNQNLANAER